MLRSAPPGKSGGPGGGGGRGDALGRGGGRGAGGGRGRGDFGAGRSGRGGRHGLIDSSREERKPAGAPASALAFMPRTVKAAGAGARFFMRRALFSSVSPACLRLTRLFTAAPKHSASQAGRGQRTRCSWCQRGASCGAGFCARGCRAEEQRRLPGDDVGRGQAEGGGGGRRGAVVMTGARTDDDCG